MTTQVRQLISANGVFRLDETPAGRVELAAAGVGLGFSSWTPLPEAEPGMPRTVELMFLPSGTLSGSVVIAAAKPVAGARVRYTPADSQYNVLAKWQTTSGEGGAFSFGRVPVLDAVVDVYLDELGSGRAEVAAATVAAGTPVTVVLTPQGENALWGLVTGSGGAGVVGAAVTMHGAGGTVLARAATDGEGLYGVDLPGDGPWTLAVVAAGLAPWAVAVAGGSAGKRQDVALDQGNSLVIGVDTDLGAWLPPGTTRLRARSDLFAGDSADLSVAAGAQLDAGDIVLNIPLETGSGQLTVNISTGVSWRLQDNRWIASGVLLAGSSADVQGVRLGDVLISADGRDMHGVSPEALYAVTRGDVGTTMHVILARDGARLSVTLTRAIVEP